MRSEHSSGLTALRDQNARRVLKTLLAHPGGVTQLQIAEQNQLARSTVSTLLSDTLSPVLAYSEREEGLRGPAPRLWSVASDAAYAVGVDIGKSHVSVALTNPYGEIVGSPVSQLTGDTLTNPDGAFDLAGELVEQVVGSAAKCKRIAAVMVGLPGMADTKRGRLVDAGLPAWEEFDVPDAVRERWPYAEPPRVFVENDANLGALGEFRRGAGRGVGSLLFIKWSTGIGSGLVLDGKLWRGKGGAAGELGHLTVNPSKADREALRLPPRSEAEDCPHCEQRECIERIAGGPALAAAIGVKDFRAVLQQAYDPDPAKQAAARKALNAAAKLIGMAIGPALTILNPERVVVGGLGGEDAYPLVVESMRRGVDQTAPRRARTDADIQPGALGVAAYVIGAATSAFEGSGIEFLFTAATRSNQELASTSKKKALAG